MENYMSIKPAHLPTQGAVLRKNNWGYAFRLTEQCPTGTGPQQVLELIKWLDVEKSPRYKPNNGATYCNVYACDVAHCSGVYLPRVWWNTSALQSLQNGVDVLPVYSQSVQELSANSLFYWLVKWSEAFGWRRLTSLDEAQNSANQGNIVVICARRKIETSSGHISCVVPETGFMVANRKDGSVVVPVQSQAGGKCVQIGTGFPWWNSVEFAEWGIWECSREQRKEVQPTHPEAAATPIRAGEGEHSV